MNTGPEASKIDATTDTGAAPAARDAWVRPEIISFEPLSKSESVFTPNPGDGFNSFS